MDKKYLKECIQNEIHSNRVQYPSMALGVVSSYDRYTNTATVIVSKPDTDEVDEILHKVPCPVLLGVQSVAPSPGMPCLVAYKGGNRHQPLITHFYNHRYDMYNYGPQNKADVAIPNFLLNL